MFGLIVSCGAGSEAAAGRADHAQHGTASIKPASSEFRTWLGYGQLGTSSTITQITASPG